MTPPSKIPAKILPNDFFVCVPQKVNFSTVWYLNTYVDRLDVFYPLQNYLLLFCQFSVVQGSSYKKKIVAIKVLVKLNQKTEYSKKGVKRMRRGRGGKTGSRNKYSRKSIQ